MDVVKILKQLTASCGNGLTETILSLLPRECNCEITPLNTIQVTVPGAEENTLLLDAHMDTIGFAVTNITQEGFVKVAPCGGVDCRVLSGSEVTIWGKEPVYGIFTIMPPHLKKVSHSEATTVEEQAIDVGLTCEEALQKISVGDRVTMRHPFVELANRRVTCCGLDNLAGVSVLIALAHRLQNSQPKNSVVLQFSTLEETGHRYAGAVTGAFSVQPQQAIVVDASFAAISGLKYATPGKIGKGVMIGISPLLSRDISQRLGDLATEHEIPHTWEVLGGSTGTNADGIVVTGVGVPTGLVSYPLLNMHTGVEVVSAADLEYLLILLETYCQKGGQDDEG